MRSRSCLAWEWLRRGLAPSQIVTQLEVRSALADCHAVLDVGCGPDSWLSQLGFERLVGVEGYAPSVEAARQNGTHQEVVLADVRHLDEHFKPGQFDACVALDLIEHLPKADGLKLLAVMEKVAARKVLLLTPSGFLPQGHTDHADLQEHLSGWEAADMRALGYRVYGALGPKTLRGEYHRIKKRPEAFWGLYSLAVHLLWTRRRPERSAAILCVKTKG